MAITSNYTLQWILPFVRESLSKREPYKEFDFPVYVEGLWTIFERVHVEGIVRKPVGAGYDATSFLVRQSPEMIRSLAIEAFNYLLSNGLLARTVTDTNIDGLRGQFPYFLTKRGADWASSKELMPEDSAQYMKLVKQLVPALDPVIEQYMQEGLSAFVGRHYFAAAVMVGAASEKAIYLLGDAIHGALKDPQKQLTLQTLLNGRSLKQLFDFIRVELENVTRKTSPVPYSAHEGAVAHFASLIEAIRVQRNDAVHPQNAAVTPDSVRLSYGAFPHALERMEALRDWFKNHPGSI